MVRLSLWLRIQDNVIINWVFSFLRAGFSDYICVGISLYRMLPFELCGLVSVLAFLHSCDSGSELRGKCPSFPDL